MDKLSVTMTSPLVGSHFRPPAKGLLQCLGAEHPLVLRREPDNQYDPLAVQVILRSDTLSDETLDIMDTVCGEYGHDRDSIQGEPEWHLGYVAAKPPKGLSPEFLAGDFAAKMEPGIDYQGKLTFLPNGASAVSTTFQRAE